MQNKNLKKKFKILLVSLALIFVFFANLVETKAEAIRFGVNKSIIELEVEKGKEYDLDLIVSNKGDQTEILVLKKEDFYLTGHQNQVIIEENQNENFDNSLIDWLKIETRELELKKNQEKKLDFKLQVPKEAEPGSYWGMIFVTSKPKAIEGTQASNVKTVGQIGVYVIVNLLDSGGNLDKRGKIVKLQSSFLVNKENRINLRLKNQGNGVFTPYGFIETENLFNLKETQNLNLEPHKLFPGRDYNYSLTFKDLSGFSIYKIKAHIYDGENNLMTKTSYSIGVWLFLIPIGFTFLILAGIIIFLRRRQKVKNSNEK
jgi:hypothetical protein